MKNVTVTMDEAILRRARIAAASEGKSLSRFIAETVEQRIGRSMTQKEAVDRFLSGPDWRSDGSRLPSRDEIYGERLRRHERASLREGPDGSDEVEHGPSMAGDPRRP